MTEPPTPLDDAVRQRLHEEAADVPGVDAMRMRVLSALEDDAWSPRRIDRPSRNGGNRPFLMLAGVAAAAAIAFVVIAGLSQRGDPVEVVTADPTPSEAGEPEVKLDSEEIQQVVAELNLDEVGGAWSVLSDADDELSLGLISAGDGADPILRIITPPPSTTTNDVVESLSSTLFDTVLVDDAPAQIGGLATRAIRLETQAGTTRLGFKIAEDTYVETTGTDRVFVVHITTAQPRTVIFWVEASTDQIDEFEASANRLVESLN